MCVLFSDGINNDPGSDTSFISGPMRACNRDKPWYPSTYEAGWEDYDFTYNNRNFTLTDLPRAKDEDWARAGDEVADFCARRGLAPTDCTARGIAEHAKSQDIRLLGIYVGSEEAGKVGTGISCSDTRVHSD